MEDEDVYQNIFRIRCFPRLWMRFMVANIPVLSLALWTINLKGHMIKAAAYNQYYYTENQSHDYLSVKDVVCSDKPTELFNSALKSFIGS